MVSVPGGGMERQRLAAADAIVIRVPRANGRTLELCREIHGLRPELPVVVVAGEVSLEAADGFAVGLAFGLLAALKSIASWWQAVAAVGYVTTLRPSGRREACAPWRTAAHRPRRNPAWLTMSTCHGATAAPSRSPMTTPWQHPERLMRLYRPRDPYDLDAPARSGPIDASTDKVEGLVRANRVEVRVLFGAYRKAPQTAGPFAFWLSPRGKMLLKRHSPWH